ncbi:MAG TPA: DUF2264 domain-containing protein [Ktedonobacteraceae bacterium]|nr:DUF2264 domain-containing protein [Ktedonobacteraceae bacterium]
MLYADPRAPPVISNTSSFLRLMHIRRSSPAPISFKGERQNTWIVDKKIAPNNSFVIHPMLIDIIETVGDHYPDWQELQEPIVTRAQRYASILERQISPEGTFPIIGRSITYRFGVFHLLAQMALRQQLPTSIVPAQVRCALTTVIRRMIEMPDTFDEQGWLTIGFCGHQPELGETYISTGSLYLCATAFLPLGLPADNPFWQGEADWTARKAWTGQPTLIDGYLKSC